MLRQAAAPEPKVSAAGDSVGRPLSGPLSVQLCRRLGEDWRDLATYFDIPPYRRRGFTPGRECHDILDWLKERDRLQELAEGLSAIGRNDLVELLSQAQ